MIIFTALPVEAKAVAELLWGKASGKDYGAYKGYSDGNISIVITGVGKLNMATAIGYFAGNGLIEADTTILNVGCCAGPIEDIGKSFLINKITDGSRDLYPDMLVKTDIEEREIRTLDTVLNSGIQDDCLYDMEASSFYLSAIKFVSSDRISLVKTIVDSGFGDSVTPKIVFDFISGDIRLKEYIESLSENKQKTAVPLITEELISDFKLTEYMKNEMNQLLIYADLNKTDYKFLLNEMRMEGIIPAVGKKQGKEALDEFKRRLLNL